VAAFKHKSGGKMRITRNQLWLSAALALVALVLGVNGYAQAITGSEQTQASAVQVPAGQDMKVDGVVYTQQGDNMVVRSLEGGSYNVSLANGPEVKEKKSNPFRGARKYTQKDLVPGLRVEVKGVGNSSGSIVATEIRLTQDDLKAAQAMDVRVAPVEKQLVETQNRLGEAEQNAQRLSGQLQEVSEVSNAARNGAKTAQQTADNALSTATDARSRADRARAGVQAADERITSLDDYTTKNIAVVHFKLGSATLSDEDKSELEKLADVAKEEKGYLIEVAGFASADGDEAYNRRLSQKRADAVIQYMAETYSIPLRRFVTPMGYGETQPVADNKTRSGRQENRRVEVRMLVNKGLIPEGDSSQISASNP
jgi:outer membrane protein OmpA-like peptidoglycan-associated protein